MCIQMIILSIIGKSAIKFQFKKHIKEKLSVSSKQFCNPSKFLFSCLNLRSVTSDIASYAGLTYEFE
jgi:hypothetical protein